MKLKQIRNGHRTHAIKLMDKMEERIKGSNPLEGTKIQLATLMKKQNVLEKCDEGILGLLTESDDITEEIGESSAFADRIIEAITRLEVSVEYTVESR